MHPNEERPQGYWEVDDPPDPTVAQTSTEFAAELGVLVQWSQIPVSEIELRTRAYGLNVPEGAVAEALRGNSLPTEELLVEILWAIGCDDETVELWVWARSNLAAAQAHFDPTTVFWVPDQAQPYTDSALADAVQERGDQGGWRGLHRHGVPDDGNTKDGNSKYAPKRLRTKESSPKTGWAMIALVATGVLALAAGAVAALSGGSETAAPPGDGGQVCCANSGAPSQTSDPLATVTPMSTPDPTTSTRPGSSLTPRPSTTTRGPSPTPSQTQGQPPQLNGGGSASCSGGSGTWRVTVSITVTLTQAASGTDPQGQASLADSSSALDFGGSSGTTFTGQATFDAGPATDQFDGSILWNVTVTVSGGGTATASGSEGVSCTPAPPA